jgi:UDP-N-acetylmuramyl pentapeptide phosphotransferase/UDP-N-acetylglucosamine-1-phosphate transferase
VPILPLIDLLILLSTGSLLIGFVLKAISITTQYRPTLLGFGALDMVLIAAIFLGMVLVLAARMWVKVNEPRLMAARRQGDLHRMRQAERDLIDAEPGAADAHQAERR